MAREYRERLRQLQGLIPRMGLELTEEELVDTAYLLAASLPDHAVRGDA